MKLVATLIWAMAVAGCGVAPVRSNAAWTDRVAAAAPEVVANQPVVRRGADSIMLLPISPAGATIGLAYQYDMPHCGINSPIDVDGSYWDAVGIAPDSTDFDGQPGAFRLGSNDGATFVRADGRTVNLVRHVGAKEFRLCS
ncbi:MAG: hypothetical protein ABI553_10160 [Chloroflexota bacterium]